MTEKRHGSPEFYKLIEEMADTHDKKSHDYASNSNPTGNYEFAGQVACMFAHSPQDAGFASRLAEKIYRLANLESGNKVPKNESIEDSERDIAVISALWMASRRNRRNKRANYGKDEAGLPILSETERVVLWQDQKLMVCAICMKNIYTDENPVGMSSNTGIKSKEYRHDTCKELSYSPFICNNCQRQFIDRPPLKDSKGNYCSAQCRLQKEVNSAGKNSV